MSVETQAPVEPTPSTPSTRTLQASNATHSCPACGLSIAVDIQGNEEAQKVIRELQAQIEMLREKAAAAADRCADYEDQIRTLKLIPREIDRAARNHTPDSVVTSSPDARPSTAGSAHGRSQSRFSFLTGRLTSPANSTTAPPLPAPPTKPSAEPDLLHELERERALRAKAEDRVRTVDSEIEELSVTLFSQANEMVAEERKARAKLEERIELLEKKDRDKTGRLDRLDRAVSRLDRVKALLNKEDTGNTLEAHPPRPTR